MENRLHLILIKKRVLSKWGMFKRSVLFYPAIFSVFILGIFLITSNIDASFDRGYSIHLPYLSSLLFSGSADAARSILSTIAAGWATILGVSFSVTLITLQLSTSRYTSHLVNRFEEDRINKLTLGWFIAVVLYSLLVLKTVKTEGGTGDVFIPIIGVNIAVLMASIGLYIFVLFLNNISSYLKPKDLVLRLVKQIICSIKPYEKREVDEKALLHIRNEIPSEQKNSLKLLEITSNEEGLVRYVDWNSLSSSLRNLKNLSQPLILIEFHKSTGETVHKGNVIATVYGINSSDRPDKVEELERKNPINNNGPNNTGSKDSNLCNLDQKIVSTIDVNKERDFHRDPAYGLELLRSFAIKSASNNDIDLTNACITGLFTILVYIWKNKDIFGLPFTIKLVSDTKTGYDKSKVPSSKINDDKNAEDKVIIIKPDEEPLSDVVLSELSVINTSATSKRDIPIIKHIISEYISTSKTLLENGKKEQFDLLTNWYSQKLIYSLEPLSKEFQDEIFVTPLFGFQKYLAQNYDYAKTSFDIYMKDIIRI